MELKSASEWKKYVDANKGDEYGEAVLKFAERWANGIEKRMKGGETLKACARSVSKEANKGIGITGFMYGLGVLILSKVWKWGDELKAWHNERYGKPAKGGVANPAVMTVDTNKDLAKSERFDEEPDLMWSEFVPAASFSIAEIRKAAV